MGMALDENSYDTVDDAVYMTLDEETTAVLKVELDNTAEELMVTELEPPNTGEVEMEVSSAILDITLDAGSLLLRVFVDPALDDNSVVATLVKMLDMAVEELGTAKLMEEACSLAVLDPASLDEDVNTNPATVELVVKLG